MVRHGFGVGAAVLFACVIAAARLDAGLVEATLEADDLAVWNGFASDFDPNWQGDTTTVITRRKIEPPTTLGGADVFGCCMMAADWYYPYGCVFLYQDDDYHTHLEQRWTVNRVDSSTVNRVTANASVNYEGTTHTASSSSESGGGRYAEIVTDRGQLWANGSAVAQQDANIGERSLSANGCFSADALLARGLERGSAESSGESSFMATYSLEKATAFSLNLDLAMFGETDLSFRAVDDATGEVLFNCETLSGVSRHLEMTGILDAGQYTFELNGDADALLDSTGAVDAAGMASYNVALDFAAESYWITVGGNCSYAERVFDTPEAAGLDNVFFAWHSNGGESFWAVDNIKVIGTTPEPAMSTLLLLGALAALALFRRK